MMEEIQKRGNIPMRKTKILFSVTIMTMLLSSTAFAGEWKQETDGRYWYQNDDGSYPVNQWMKIEGKDYYFDANGYMLSDTVTPDGYVVGSDGAWIEGAGTETQESNRISNVTFSNDSITQDLTISDYKYEQLNYWTYHIYEITNRSPYTLKVNINETAVDGSENPVGAKSVSQEAIPSGHTVFVYTLYDTIWISGYNASFQVKQEKYYVPVAQNISLNSIKSGDKIIVTATNNGNVVIDFPEIVAVFFNGDKVVRVDSTFVTDGDYELKPGASITKELSTYNEFFTDYIVHVTGRASK